MTDECTCSRFRDRAQTFASGANAKSGGKATADVKVRARVWIEEFSSRSILGFDSSSRRRRYRWRGWRERTMRAGRVLVLSQEWNARAELSGER